MRVLVACEESQEVCKAFRARGHTAFSCDIIPCSGGHPEWHIQADAREIIKLPWDMIIAHPPCTYMSNAGARWLYRGGHLDSERFVLGMEGRKLFFELYEANCEKIAIENPVPSSVFKLPKPSQVIQPYEYGEPWSKKTYLWLKGLPSLIPTNIVTEHYPYITSGSYRKSHDPKYKGASRRGGSAKSRSKTFPGIAAAMAEQWG